MPSVSDWDEKEMNTRYAELRNVCTFIMNEKEMKVKETFLEGFGTTKYFRGVNFHVSVLRNDEKILSMIPSFVNDKSIT